MRAGQTGDSSTGRALIAQGTVRRTFSDTALQNTTIAVVATTACLTRIELSQLAQASRRGAVPPHNADGHELRRRRDLRGVPGRRTVGAAATGGSTGGDRARARGRARRSARSRSRRHSRAGRRRHVAMNDEGRGARVDRAHARRVARVEPADSRSDSRGTSWRCSRTSGDWLLVRGEDGYDGWMHRGYVVDGSDERSPDAAQSDAVVRLPRPRRSDRVHRERFHSRAWLAPSEHARDRRARSTAGIAARDVSAERRRHCSTAVERFAGTPYQWGGVSPWGADCSGLTQTTFWLHGVSLAARRLATGRGGR